MSKVKVVFITGGSASGKTTLADQIISKFGGRALLVSQDSFYKKLGKGANFDHPDALDFEKMKDVIRKLKDNKPAEIPIYDFTISNPVGSEIIQPKPILIFEGLFTLYDPELAELADFKIFVDTPADVRLSRRIQRDINERKRALDSVVDAWLKDVKPGYDTFIHPMRKYSDIVIPYEKVKNSAINSILVTIAHIHEDISKYLK